MIKVKKDLTGQIFGKLIVLQQVEDYVYPNGKHSSRWLCECNCDDRNQIEVNGNSLTSGATRSCGCLKKENLVGRKYGRLTVIKQVDQPETRKNKNRFWLCACDCGSSKEVIVSTSDLNSGHVSSCGCFQKEQIVKKLIERNQQSAGVGKKNKRTKFYQENDYAYGYTSNTKQKFLIDLEDVEFAQKYTWHESDQGYIMSRIDGKLVRLHRILMNCPDGMDVDHIKHNTYDNRKSQLRLVTCSQNNMNKESKGVVKLKNGKYRAYIGIDYQTIYLGVFDTFEEARVTRKEAENKYFGEYSYDNSINVNLTESML